ncbi:site-specific integrase [Halorhodospira sp. 9621]|uniref:site-specific integrase n=1 Tax=Halorhodospira sp. 9621 TaxID=2899135 RepID=UPI001EE7F0E6|nr:site-specific integrase [Halorhodospira sp. 9621]MCG5531824.1 site-specific integrase [Halorhodospira sp. 9621]
MATIRKRPGPSGRSIYHVQVRIKGYPQRTATFDRKTDAQQWALKTESEMRAGRYIDTKASSTVLLGELFARYRKQVSPQHKGAEAESYRLAAWERCNPLRDVALADLRSSDVAAWLEQRAQTVKEDTVRRERGLLQQVIEHARNEWGYTLPENPVARARRPKRGNSSNARTRRLLPGEEERILEACRPTPQRGRYNPPTRNAYLEAVVIVALETGMRQGEIVKLTWSTIDKDTRVATILDSKNGETRSVPLSPRVMSTLSTIPRSSEGKVFPFDGETIKKAWKRACKRARANYDFDCAATGIAPDPRMFHDLRFHDLRHEATSRLFERGFSVMEVSSVTGHKDLRMLKRYTHMNAATLAERMAAHDPALTGAATSSQPGQSPRI